MATTYERTITVRGIEKAVDRFADSLNYAEYSLDGEVNRLDFLKVIKGKDEVKFYLYFDDKVEGLIEKIQVLDKDEEVIIKISDVFTKESRKGFYVLFKYKFEEEVVQ